MKVKRSTRPLLIFIFTIVSSLILQCQSFDMNKDKTSMLQLDSMEASTVGGNCPEFRQFDIKFAKEPADIRIVYDRRPLEKAASAPKPSVMNCTMANQTKINQSKAINGANTTKGKKNASVSKVNNTVVTKSNSTTLKTNGTVFKNITKQLTLSKRASVKKTKLTKLKGLKKKTQNAGKAKIIKVGQKAFKAKAQSKDKKKKKIEKVDKKSASVASSFIQSSMTNSTFQANATIADLDLKLIITSVAKQVGIVKTVRPVKIVPNCTRSNNTKANATEANATKGKTTKKDKKDKKDKEETESKSNNKTKADKKTASIAHVASVVPKFAKVFFKNEGDDRIYEYTDSPKVNSQLFGEPLLVSCHILDRLVLSTVKDIVVYTTHEPCQTACVNDLRNWFKTTYLTNTIGGQQTPNLTVLYNVDEDIKEQVFEDLLDGYKTDLAGVKKDNGVSDNVIPSVKLYRTLRNDDPNTFVLV